jgi:hypothetical protein
MSETLHSGNKKRLHVPVSVQFTQSDDTEIQSVESLGQRLDADVHFDNGFRVVQFTPPGSGVRSNSTRTLHRPPRLGLGFNPIVSDIEAASDELVARGVGVSEVFHTVTPDAQFKSDHANYRRAMPRSATRTERGAIAEGHDSAARAHRPRKDGVRLGERPRRIQKKWLACWCLPAHQSLGLFPVWPIFERE